MPYLLRIRVWISYFIIVSNYVLYPMEPGHAIKEKLKNKMLGGIRFSFLHLFFCFSFSFFFSFFFSTYPQRMAGDLVPSFIVGSFYGHLIHNN